MKDMKQKKKAIIILVPYPALGHVNPMQKLASAFVSHGFEAVIVLPQHLIHRRKMMMMKKKNKVNVVEDDDDDDESMMIKWVGLEDGVEDTATVAAPDFFGIESAMEEWMPRQLEELLRGHDIEEVCMVVVDLLASWAIHVADKFGIPTAGFWPAMFASYLLISSIPHLLRSSLISHTGLPQHEGKITFVPELPAVSTEDLPWLIGSVGARKARFKFWKRTLERSRSLKWLLVNSFPDESDVEKLQLQSTPTQLANKGCPRVLPIGPICSSSSNKSLSLSLSLSLSFWEEEDLSCLKWLAMANHKANSVVYVSFGSWVSPIDGPNLKNLALALEASGRPFIWVLRPTWREALPVGFLERVSSEQQGKGMGRVVSWAPQTEVLQHESVGCFITHCGWNSTLEALQFQKKLLCYPVAGDQFVNCAYIVEVWRVGLRLNGLGPKDVEEGIARVMEDEEMGTRLMKLRERIVGMQGDNKRGAFLLKAFVEHLKKASNLHEGASELN